jgi:hypothetical protein
VFLESFKDIKQQFGPALCIDHEPQLGQNSRGCLSAGFYCKYTFYKLQKQLSLVHRQELPYYARESRNRHHLILLK